MIPLGVKESLVEVRERVAAAAHRTGRAPGSVRVVGVTKGVEVGRISEAVGAGLSDLGENRAQELDAKRRTLPVPVDWHFLGAIQTNKVKLLAGVRLVHGLCRVREAAALEAASEPGETREVLVEVNVAGESTKRGVTPAGLGALLEALAAHTQVRACGLMFVAPRAENPEDVRWVFAEGRRLLERYSDAGLHELSMGMSDDYEVAIEEGATIVRIGRAIFGPRPAP